MSQFLFSLAMEYLSRALFSLKIKEAFHYHPRCAKLGISHLCFADDLLVFATGEVQDVSIVHEVF